MSASGIMEQARGRIIILIIILNPQQIMKDLMHAQEGYEEMARMHEQMTELYRDALENMPAAGQAP